MPNTTAAVTPTADPQPGNTDTAWFSPGASLRYAWGEFSRNPGAASALATLLGGLILLGYALRLGFLPDLELSSVLGTLVLVSVVIPFLFVVVWLIFLLPALLGLIFIRRDDVPPWKSTKIRVLHTVKIVAVWCLIAVIAAKMGWAWLIYGFYVFSLGLATLLLFYKRSLGVFWRYIRWNCFLFLVVGFWLVLFYYGYLFLIFSNEKDLFVFLLWMGAGGAWLIQTRKIIPVFIVQFITTVAVFSYADVGIDDLDKFVMAPAIHLQLSDVDNVTITVSKGASAALQAACQTKNSEQACASFIFSQTENTASYQGVTILSRLGNQVYLKVGEVKAVIDKKDVYGWSSSSMQ